MLLNPLKGTKVDNVSDDEFFEREIIINMPKALRDVASRYSWYMFYGTGRTK